MFVGHYAAALALKGKEPKTPLGPLFIAVQFVDILFFPLALLGLESIEFVPGYTAVNDFKMEFPFTHGIVGTLFWCLVFATVYYVLAGPKRTDRKRIAWVLAIAVASHWVADLVVHTPDLPIVAGEPKLGFGLWQYKAATVWLEALLLIAGLGYYLKKTTSRSRTGKFASIALVAFLIAVNYLNYYVLPANNDLMGLTVSALVTYFVLAGIAFWVDRQRA
ncbi:hypothetical protein ABV409_00725 [Flagellimonas sp. DF-77]|uniref:hypothetical protein n=1 Tax=Flagellimonas algarum TaxID=3230298 RepID=UPI003390E107